MFNFGWVRGDALFVVALGGVLNACGAS